MKTRFLAVCVLGMAMAQTLRSGLILNGSFEDYTGTWDVLSIVDSNIPVGSTVITSWQVVLGPIDLVGAGGWNASDGGNSLDLAGAPGVGGIEQSFVTTVGGLYRVQFDFAASNARFDTESLLKKLRVEAAGSGADFEIDATSIDPLGPLLWTARTFDYTANSTLTTLRFLNNDPAIQYNGPVLDNVRVDLIPEPAVAGLLGLGLGCIVALRPKSPRWCAEPSERLAGRAVS